VPFFYVTMSEEEKNLPPSKMRGVAFPKAKYGAIAAVIIIVIVNLIYYKDALLSLIK
jgi:cell division protein FtsL